MARINVSLPKDLIEAVRNLPEGDISKMAESGISAEVIKRVREAANAKLQGSRKEMTPEEKTLLTLNAFVDFHHSKLEEDEDVTHLSQEDQQTYQALAIGFEYSIRDLMRTQTTPLTSGSEADIFRIRIGDSEFVVVKRRFDSVSGTKGTDNEYRLQMAARNVAKKTEGVRVPKIFQKIPGEDGSQYIVMECVKGKTLWNLMLESLSNPKSATQGSLALSDTNPIARFFDSRRHFERQFDNDTDAEQDMIERYRQFGEKLGMAQDLGARQIDPVTRQISYPYLKPYLDTDLSKLSMFDTETVAYITKKLRKYLTDLHDAGIYHRDLNIRNVMLTDEGDIYVIDFGKGVKAQPNDDGVYDTEEGKYDSDFAIIDQFKAFGPKKETDADRMVREAETAKAGIDFTKLREAAELVGLDPSAVEKTARKLSIKRVCRYFEAIFVSHVDASVARMSPTRQIQPGARKPEAQKATESGMRTLLAELALADRAEVEKFSKWLTDAVSKDYGSKPKNDRAEKIGKVFTEIVEAALL